MTKLGILFCPLKGRFSTSNSSFAPWVERHLSEMTPLGLVASEALERMRSAVSLANKLPRGFEKFYQDKKGASSSEQEKEEEKGSTKKVEGEIQKMEEEMKKKFDEVKKQKKDFFFSSERPKGGGGGGGGGKKSGGGWGDADRQKIATGLGAIAFAAALFAGMNQLNYREISWKEFVNNFLAKGVVEKLVVVNGKWVKVGGVSSVEWAAQLFFFQVDVHPLFDRWRWPMGTCTSSCGSPSAAWTPLRETWRTPSTSCSSTVQSTERLNEARLGLVRRMMTRHLPLLAAGLPQWCTRAKLSCPTS